MMWPIKKSSYTFVAVVIRQQVMFLLLRVSLPYHSISIPLWRKCLGLLLPKPNCCTMGSERPRNLARHRCSWQVQLVFKEFKKKTLKPWSFNEYILVSGLVSMGTAIGWLSDRSLDNNAFYCYSKEWVNSAPGVLKNIFTNTNFIQIIFTEGEMTNTRCYGILVA